MNLNEKQSEYTKKNVKEKKRIKKVNKQMGVKSETNINFSSPKLIKIIW